MLARLLYANPSRFNIASRITSRRCHGRITIDDVVFEKSAKSTRPEYVPRKYCEWS